MTNTPADVCYRHPQRASWTLCSRCGRTICPECQILTPSGVQCPDCVRETGGSVTWRSAGGEAKRPAAKARRARPSRPAGSDRPRWMQGIGQMLRPGSEAPVLTRGIVAIVGVLWVLGFFMSSLPLVLLALIPPASYQVWRFVSAPFVYPSLLEFPIIFALLLNSVFFLLTAPFVERALGRARFAWLFLAAGALSGACMLLAGGSYYGLVGPLFAMFGAYLVFTWQHPQARVQALIIIGLNLLFVLAFGARTLPAIIGGLIAGAGIAFLLQRYDDRPTSQRRIPYLISGGVVVGFIALALLRTFVL